LFQAQPQDYVAENTILRLLFWASNASQTNLPSASTVDETSANLFETKRLKLFTARISPKTRIKFTETKFSGDKNEN
jgi:hypothetical protein